MVQTMNDRHCSRGLPDMRLSTVSLAIFFKGLIDNIDLGFPRITTLV